MEEEIKLDRTEAYIEMLKTAYQVDDDGLADMLGINRRRWTRERKGGIMEMRWTTIVKLASVTGVSIDWLFQMDETTA